MQIGKYRVSAWAVLALGLAALLVIGVRLRLLGIPLERDEGEFAYAGQLMLDGVPPYKLEYNIKLPGTYVAYAAMMGMFGQTTEAIHFGFLLTNLASITFLFFITRRLLDTAHASVAAVCFALFSLSPAVLGLQGHATHLVVLTMLGGWWVLLKAQDSRGGPWYALSGFLFGWSFLCKQPGIFFAMFGGAVLLSELIQTPRLERRAKGRGLISYCAGVAAPFLLTCLWMWRAGTFQRFWFWTMQFAPVHGKDLSEDQISWQLSEMSRRGFALEGWGLVALVGLAILLAGRSRAETKFPVVCLVGLSLCALLVSFYLFPHYFIVLIPAASILVAVAFGGMASRLNWPAAGALFVAGCAAFLFANGATWFARTPLEVVRTLYQREPFPEAVEAGRYIREHSAPGDTIAVFGSEPEIFFYARRHSATGYIYMYDLASSGPYAETMQSDMQREIERAKPLFMIMVNVPTSWRATRDTKLELSKFAADYAGKSYERVGFVIMAGGSRTEYMWREASKTSIDRDAMTLEILKRRIGN